MNSEKLDSFFGEGTVLKGTLKFKGLLRFDGEFDGEIQTKDTLIIGETGKVKAGIQAGSVFNFGKMDGNVKAEFKLQLYATSHLNGNIEAPVIMMEEGAHFEGACKMPPKPANMPTTPQPSVKKEPPPKQTADIPKADVKPAAKPKKSGGWFGILLSFFSLFKNGF